MIVKVCGMRNSQNIIDIVNAGADWIGMIFWNKSSRYVPLISTNTGIMPDITDDYCSMDYCFTSDNNKKRVGVFVNDTPQNIITRLVSYNLDIIQLHGDESPTEIINLRNTIVPDIKKNIKIMKAIGISDIADIDKYKQYEDCVDYFLFDTKSDSRGGTGQHFDWSLLNNYSGNIPFLLSGGISIKDICDIKKLNIPMLIGIDINSKFEIKPALKNVSEVKWFIDKIKMQ